jgi:hypothetical protein
MEELVKKSNFILTLVICLLMVLVIRAAVSDVAGMWELSMSSDHGDFSKEALFKQDGEDIVVIIDESEGKGTIKNNQIEWTILLNTEMGDIDAAYSGKVEADTMEGEVEIMGMSITWSAKRIN